MLLNNDLDLEWVTSDPDCRRKAIDKETRPSGEDVPSQQSNKRLLRGSRAADE